MPFVKITAITSRKHPIFQTVFNAHIEHTTLGAMPRMGSLYRRLREVVPSVTMVSLPVSGMGRSHAYVSLKKARDGEPKLAALAALSIEHTIKHVFVVDDDIDVFAEEWVMGETGDTVEVEVLRECIRRMILEVTGAKDFGGGEISNKENLILDRPSKSRGYMSGNDVTWTGENTSDHIYKWLTDMGFSK